MMMHLKYLKYVLVHKFWVIVAGIALGVPIWRTLLHDWSKFRPREWFPYARYFYGSQGANPRTKEQVAEEFDVAWNYHQHQNDHHWQYWVLREDDGAVKILPMPDVCRREMLADWYGAGRALGKTDILTWYLETRKHRDLHPDTLAWVESMVMVREREHGRSV